MMNKLVCAVSALILIGGAIALASGFGMDWMEPELGKVSETGTVIEVKDYRCEVESPYRISCLNVGRVCVDWRRKKVVADKKTFGCAIEGSPNFPCPSEKDREVQRLKEQDGARSCYPLTIGGF